MAEQTTNTCTYREAKDFVMTAAHTPNPKTKLPSGAQQNVWMCLMSAPNDNYNEVYPNIILGDYKYAKDPDKLQELGVTHVINCACGKKYNMIDTSQDYFQASGIKFHGIAATDIMTFKMTPHFEAAVNFLKEALESGGKVYVHCMSGVSRSTTIVIAYLMSVKGVPLMTALKMIRDKRKIMPNDGFLKELVTYNNSLFGGDATDE